MDTITVMSVGYAAKAILDSSPDFTVHSVFDRTVNLISSGNKLVSLSISSTTDFPSSLRTSLQAALGFQTMGLRQGMAVSVAEGLIAWPGKTIAYGYAPIYRPAIHGPISPADKRSVENALSYFAQRVDSLNRPKGLSAVVTLLTNSRSCAQADIEDPLCQLVSTVSSRILSPGFSLADLPGVLAPLFGRGPGLTPSGDDYIAGLMLAFHLGFKSLGMDDLTLADACTEVLHRAEGTTRFSREMLLYASKGELTYDSETVVLGALGDAERDISRAVSCMLAYGATSGVDQLAGIATGLRFMLQLM